MLVYNARKQVYFGETATLNEPEAYSTFKRKAKLRWEVVCYKYTADLSINALSASQQDV